MTGSSNSTYMFYCLLITICTACGSMQKYSGESQKIIVSEPKILFVSILLEKNYNGTIDITKSQTKIVNGYMRTSDNNYTGDTETYILCSILEKNNRSIKQLKIDNPLLKIVEFVDQNGNLNKRLIESKKEWLTFRTEYDSKLRRIKLELFLENKLSLIDQIDISL